MEIDRTQYKIQVLHDSNWPTDMCNQICYISDFFHHVPATRAHNLVFFLFVSFRAVKIFIEILICTTLSYLGTTKTTEGVVLALILDMY